jgi:hypothetical protein
MMAMNRPRGIGSASDHTYQRWSWNLVTSGSRRPGVRPHLFCLDPPLIHLYVPPGPLFCLGDLELWLLAVLSIHSEMLPQSATMMTTPPLLLRNIASTAGALTLGLLAGCAVNLALISLNSHVLYPPASPLDLTNLDDFKTYVSSLPGAAFGTVFCAHWSQTVVGGYIFALFATEYSSRSFVTPNAATQLVAALTMVGSIFNMLFLSGIAPVWTWLEVPIHPILAYLVASTIVGASDNNNDDGKLGGGDGHAEIAKTI